MKINLSNAKVYEVGAGDLFTCKSRPLWDAPGAQVTLFEPNPLLYVSLLRKVQSFPNVTLHHVAISDTNGLGWLVSAGLVSYLQDVPSHLNTIFRGKLTQMLSPFKVPVNVMTFDTFDHGDIDLLFLGMEGSEYTLFPCLSSLPHVIILNNHFANDYGYTFPRWEVVQEWCTSNGYNIYPGVPDITLVNRQSLAAGVVQP